MEYYITVMDIVKCTLQKQPMTEWQGYNRLRTCSTPGNSIIIRDTD